MISFIKGIGYHSIMAGERFVPSSLIIGELLYNQEVFEVPPYQRDYKWREEHLVDFWKDLNDISEEVYYFGSMIFQSTKEAKKTLIIDGQQRLTTVTILLAVIRDVLQSDEIQEQKNATLTQSYIIKEITRDKKIRKLTLNLRNKQFFYNCIQCNQLDEEHKSFDEFEKEFGTLKDTDKLIKNTYNFFKTKIEETLQTKSTKEEKIDYLMDLSERTREKLAIISITVSNIKDAYMIFETINQRGVELAVSDLFKNYLISKSIDKEEMVKIWERIFNALDEKIKGFLKHYWNSKKAVIEESKLFRELIAYIENSANQVNVDSLTREIEKESKVYSALQNPEDDSWQENEEIIELLEDMRTLKIKQAFPLLMVGRNLFSEDEFKKLLQLVINFEFRYHIICNFPSNIMERKYSEIAIKIRNSVVRTTKDVSNELKKLEDYPSDETFKAKFKGKILKRDSKIARYLLIKIELNKLKKIDEETENTEPLNYQKFTLEHILPQNLDTDWKDYYTRKNIKINDVKNWIERIGNLTLLDKKKNGFSRNEFITKKCQKAYDISLLNINKPLKGLTDWDLTKIEEREDDFLKEAFEVWKLDI